MNKIIFLDVDNVLNITCNHTWDKQSVQNLNEITKHTNAKFVITSSWRVDYNLDDIRKLFINQGIKADVVGITPFLNDDKGVEINLWLELYKERANVTNWIVLDDATIDIIKHITECQRIFKVKIGKGLRDIKIKNKMVHFLQN